MITLQSIDNFTFLQKSEEAYEILKEKYPDKIPDVLFGDEWCDIVEKEGKQYAVYSEGPVTVDCEQLIVEV